jgi:cytosine/uracil/thiamine/allantoin permease
MAPKLGERKGIILGGVLGTATALLFPTLMNYEHFLLFIGAMFCPLFGVVLADYFLMRNGSLAVEDLYRREGRYWFTQGVNLRAILAWAMGFGVYLGFSPMLMEQVFGMNIGFPWQIGSSLPSLVLAGVVYWVLVQRK